VKEIYSAEVFKKILVNSSIDLTKNLCLSGGVALNCPANTRLVNESSFSNLHVPPAVSDMGLSIGSALALYYNVMGNKRLPEKTTPRLAYLGLNNSGSLSKIKEDLKKFEDKIKIEEYQNYCEVAAKDLFENKIIGWFEGRSEVGPRALGHRSILSNPTYLKNWERVNKVKGREWWRPFAPAVLQEYEHNYFTNTQFPTYFMLLNAEVKVDTLPAITHADRSARVQSVTFENGYFYSLLKEFHVISGVPVLMNTSFNGPGEPIVETPEHAIRFLLNSDLDALYFEGFKVIKR